MEQLIPKRAFTLVESKPGEKIFEICIALKDVQGAVARTANVLSDSNVDIRTSTLFHAVGLSGVGFWTSFIDMSKASMRIEKIEESLRKLDVVKDVRIVNPQPLPYDVIHFPMMHGGSAAMIMPIELFSSLFEEIERILTQSGFAAVFYNAGKKSGAFIAELFARRYGLKGEPLLMALVQSTKAVGWGQVEDIKLDVNRPFCSIKIRKCFEVLLRGSRKEKACHWTRGFVAGALGAVVNRPLEAAELKCTAAGDEICEFEVKQRI